MALCIQNILNHSLALDGNISSSRATQPPSLTPEPSPGASSCPQSPYTPTDLSGTAPGQAVPAKRPLEDWTTEDVGSQYRNLHPLTGVPTGPPSAMSGLGRLYSQPPIASPRTQAPLSTLPLSYAPCHPRPPLVYSQISSSPNKRAGRPLPGPRPSSETATPRLETRRGHGMGGSLFGVDGQQAFLALPGNQTHIPVQMEFSQASKKADEKRQRNAVASTRHRLKKKNMEAERAKQLQEITQERDFYREECNRLRDIIAQTPSISYHAAGPPSPTISTSNSYAGTGSLASGPSGSMGYGYASWNERPSQRRRTNNHPEYSFPSYRSPASAHPSESLSGLPPMSMSGYGGPSRPSSAAS